MLETKEARLKLRHKLETWPDDRKSPVTINQGLELLDMVERLENEADWLATAQNWNVSDNDPTRCPEGKEPPDGCIGINDCKNCWRTAAREAVAERAEQSDIEPR